MKKSLKVLSATTMAALVAVPSIVAPVSAASTASPDQLVYKNENGQVFSISYADYQDTLFDDTLPLKQLIAGKTPLAIGIQGTFVDYTKYQDLLFESPETSGPELLGKAVEDETNLIPTDEQDGFDTTVEFDDSGKPIYKGGSEVEPGELAVESVSAITTTKVRVQLTEAVDTVSSANFKVTGASNATVNTAEFADDTKKVVILTISGLQVEKSYTVTATNLEVNGQVQEDSDKEFTVPTANSIYNDLQVKFTNAAGEEVTEIAADGASKVLVSFILDADIENTDDVVVAFTSTFGNFSQARVTVQNGVATATLTSEFFDSLKVSDIRAQVVEAADKNLIGLTKDTTFVLNPNPGDGSAESVGASLVSAESNQADRITLYFNRDVDVADYVAAKTVAGYDDTKAEIVITQPGVGSVTPVGLLKVAGNPKALQVLVDEPLIDNKEVNVTFTDKTGSVEVKRDASFVLTDARTPELLSVVPDGLNALVATFSEPIYEINTNDLLNNITIDGVRLTNEKFGVASDQAKAEVQSFVAKDGTDNRHVVKIVLGKGADGKQIYFKPGTYSFQATKVSDWAGDSDTTNIIANNTLDFTVKSDDTIPTPSVKVQSPEQILLSFDRTLTDVTLADLISKLDLQIKENNEYVTDARFELVSALNSQTGGKNGNGKYEILVTQVDNNNYLLELNTDWTQIYDTAGTTKNFYNDAFRLVVNEEAVQALASGKFNEKATLGLGEALLSPDTTSPVINNVDYVDRTDITVSLSEPVKLVLDDGTGTNTSVTKNNEGKTLGQKQADLQDATVEFIKADNSETVQGTITGFADDYDQELSVTADKELSAGNWKVVVRSITDDYGNTAESREFTFTIDGETATTSPFRVTQVWTDDSVDAEGVYDAAGDFEAIYVKFNKAGSLTGDFKNILKASNYSFNGKELPKDAQVLSNVKGYDSYDDLTDSITIILPKGTLQVAGNVLNIFGTLESSVGEKLSNPGEYVMSASASKVTIANDGSANAAKNAKAALEKALANPVVTEIELNYDFGAGLSEAIEITRPVTVDATTNIANLVFETEQAGTITLDGIVTDLTINTPNAEFVNNATVTNVLLEDTYSKTFTNTGTITTLTVTDTNGASIDNQNTIGTLTVNAGVEITIENDGTITTLENNGVVALDGANPTDPVIGNPVRIATKFTATATTITTADTVTLTLEDEDLNVSTTTADTVTVKGSNGVTYTLTETGADTGEFTVTIPAGLTAGTIRFTYNDAKNALGVAEVLTVTVVVEK